MAFSEFSGREGVGVPSWIGGAEGYRLGGAFINGFNSLVWLCIHSLLTLGVHYDQRMFEQRIYGSPWVFN